MHVLKNKKFIYFFIFFITTAFFPSCRSSKELPSNNGSKPGSSQSSSKKIKSKYASQLGVDEDRITNTRLYAFIDDWYGTPYKYGGKSKKGIDCSNFTATLYKEAYNKMISGSSASLYEQCKVVSTRDLEEGDLVFFKIEKDEVSHIGVYLQNNKFVHATTKKGVMIDDLDEAYYKKYFYKAGRIK
jgi:lipoprotein Spr